ncbi:MAG: hypothetical protein ACJAQ6_002335 [Arenicella sp.]|jgi:hypothetical protein
MKRIKTRWVLLIASVALGLAWGAFKILPFGLPPVEAYFAPIEQRKLQEDEIGQIISVEETFFGLSLSGDDFKGWDTSRRDFWKYSIAFSAYGIPSLIMIDPENKQRYQALMDAMIWKMKSKRVWSDFTERGFGADPITVQNIMYKGHLNLMYGLYHLSTGDLRYAREHAWLTEQIAKEMRLHHNGKYEGVTCEPNAWFVECNAIGMLSLHVFDKLYGTKYTENEIQWSLNFIMNRMRDPDTGLFYRAYLPNHDLIKKELRGYTNAWILSFLKPFAAQQMEQIYPSFKTHLVESIGPYAAVLNYTNGEPDQVAQIFGLWAAKEHNDQALFEKLRNVVDKFGGLQPLGQNNGMVYDDPNSVLINGVVLASKVHLGWDAVLAHPWPASQAQTAIADTQELEWKDILPQQAFAMGSNTTIAEQSVGRACPSCFWGDYKSIRMKKIEELKRCSVERNVSCSLDQMDTDIIEIR